MNEETNPHEQPGLALFLMDQTIHMLRVQMGGLVAEVANVNRSSLRFALRWATRAS